MKPTELSELFNFSERKKYDIIKRGVTYDLFDTKDLDETCIYGTIALVTDDDQDPDVFPTIDVVVITGYKHEDHKRSIIVRKLSDLSVSYSVTNVFPLDDGDRPLVLSTDVATEPCLCRVIGYSVTRNCLYVMVIGGEYTDIIGLPLEGIQAIKKD